MCLRITAANAWASLPVSTFWPGIEESGVPTICSRARSLRTVSRAANPTATAATPNRMRKMLAAMPPLRARSFMLAPLRVGDGAATLPDPPPARIGVLPPSRAGGAVTALRIRCSRSAGVYR